MSEAPSETPAISTSHPPAWRRAASLAGAVFLGAVLLFAGWAKALDPAAFAKQIATEGLDFLLPASAVALFALAVEFFLGSALLLGLRRRWLLVATSGLVAFFVFLTARTYWRHLQGIAPEEESCGCFGRLIERTPAEAFWQDIALLVPALLLAWLAFSPGRGKWRLAVAMLVTAALTVFSVMAPDIEALDDLVTTLKPGIQTETVCVGKAEDGSRVCLDGIVPEIEDGQHVLLIADLQDESLVGQISALNEFAWAGGVPRLWILSSANEEELFQFRFQRGSTFEIREAPSYLLKTMYRQMPRSFLVENGRIVETWRGYPPLERWLAKEQ
jgi:uncharacterized membrane protein YphA (DoxX/SURF4 family)